MALSQFIPQVRVGYLYTYWAPLVSTLSGDNQLPIYDCLYENVVRVLEIVL